MRFMRLAVLAAAFCVVTTANGEDKAPAGKAHGQLPQNWSKLGLTDAQKTKVYEIQTKYSNQIDELSKQIEALKAKSKKEQEGVLTDAQKARLREIMAEKAPASDK